MIVITMLGTLSVNSQLIAVQQPQWGVIELTSEVQGIAVPVGGCHFLVELLLFDPLFQYECCSLPRHLD